MERRKRERARLRLREERAGRGERRFGQKRSAEMVSLLVDRGRRTPSRVVVSSTLRLTSFFPVPASKKRHAVQRIHRMLFRLPFQDLTTKGNVSKFENYWEILFRVCYCARIAMRNLPCFENNFYIRARPRVVFAIFLCFNCKL